MFSLRPSPNHTPIKYMCSINQRTLTYLTNSFFKCQSFQILNWHLSGFSPCPLTLYSRRDLKHCHYSVCWRLIWQILPLSYGIREQIRAQNYRIPVYLLFIQHKSLKIRCGMEIIVLSWFDIGTSFKGPKLVYSMSFEMNRQQTYTGSSFFMFDGWEDRSYSILHSSQFTP